MKSSATIFGVLLLSAFSAFAEEVCDCVIGEAESTEVSYDCCSDDNTISETITAPITCDDTDFGIATGYLTAIQEVVT